MTGFALQLALLFQPAHQRVAERLGLTGMAVEADICSHKCRLNRFDGRHIHFRPDEIGCWRRRLFRRRCAVMPLKKFTQRIECVIGLGYFQPTFGRLRRIGGNALDEPAQSRVDLVAIGFATDNAGGGLMKVCSTGCIRLRGGHYCNIAAQRCDGIVTAIYIVRSG